MAYKYTKQLSTVLTILLTSLASAQSQIGSSLQQASATIPQLIVAILGPLFAALLGGDPSLLFEKVLLFFVLTSVIFVTVKQMDLFSGKPRIIAIVTFAVSILATRFMLETNVIYTVLLPYSVLGVSLSAFLPLLIAFFFVYGNGSNPFIKSSFMRKIFWIFFTVVFFAMWNIRYQDVGSASWIYFWSAVLSLLFFIFDGSIRRAMIKSEMEILGHNTRQQYAADIHQRMHELNNQRQHDWITESYYNKKMRDLRKQLDRILKV